MRHPGNELANAGKFFALDQLGLGGFEGFHGGFQLLAGLFQVLGHLVEHVRQFAAFIPGMGFDATREIAATDGFGTVA